MGVVTLQTAFTPRDDPLVAFAKGLVAEIMATATEVGNGLLLLRGMGIMANPAFAIDRRRMPRSPLPVGIDVMAIDTESGLLLQ